MKDVCGKVVSPCPIMTVHLPFVSHRSCLDTRLYHESSTFGHKDPANISQLERGKQPNLGSGQPKTAMLQICVIHTPSLFFDKDFHPSCRGRDHSPPTEIVKDYKVHIKYQLLPDSNNNKNNNLKIPLLPDKASLSHMS